MFSYEAYGLAIRSEVPFPELVGNGEAGVDLVIRRGGGWPRPPGGANVNGWVEGPAAVYYSWPGVAAFRIREGREVLVEPATGADEVLTRHLLITLALGIALHQRGRLVLHASAVEVGGQAVLFLGDSRVGKSTSAAALHAWGHRILADDVVAVEVPQDRCPRVLPAFPQLRVCPRAASWLGYDPRELLPLPPPDNRVVYREARAFLRTPLPPAVIYLLAEGPREAAEPIRPQEAVLELVRHTRMSVTQVIRATGAGPDHLRGCARLAGRVPVRRLTRRLSLAALPDLRRVLEADLAGLGKHAGGAGPAGINGNP
jgi:HPr Serine kinase C-terminal domain